MRNIFSYDSVLMRFLTRLFDIVILNAIFVLCSLPIITVGAAQAGLASGVRAMIEPNTDKSPYRAFFRGFSSGFGKITILWICCAIPIGCILYLLLGYITTGAEMQAIFLLTSCLIAVSSIMFQVMASFMHSRFDCKLMDLVKNSWLMVITYPLRTLIMGFLIWVPLFFALMEPYVFLAFSPLFIFFYYGLTFMLCHYLIRKPFQKIQDIYFPDAEI